MLKYVPLSLILASLSVSTCYGMDAESRREAIRARLQKKREGQLPSFQPPQHQDPHVLAQLTEFAILQQEMQRAAILGEQMESLQERLQGASSPQDQMALIKGIVGLAGKQTQLISRHTQRQLEPQERFLNILVNNRPNHKNTVYEKYTGEIKHLIGLANTIGKIQIEKIGQLDDRDRVALTQLPIIKNNLLESLKSGLEFIEKFYAHPVNKKRFADDRYEGFSTEQIAAVNILPFIRHDSARYDEMLSRVFSLDMPEPQITAEHASRLIEDHGTQKPGALLKVLLSSIEEADFNDPICLMKQYASLLEYGLSELYKSNKAKDGLTLKRRRLLFSFSNGEVEICLKFSRQLFPYVQNMQKVLQIAEYDKIFSYQNLIEQELDARKLEVQSPPPFSRKTIEALQVRYQEREIPEKETPIEPPVIIKKKLLPAKEEGSVITSPTEDYSSPSTPQNLKKGYKGPADTDLRYQRKQDAKDMKKKNVQPLTQPIKLFTEKTEQPKAHTSIVKIGGGPFKIYKRIVDGTFKGSMEKVVLLIEALGGKVDEGRSGSRIKFELPYITHQNTMAYHDMLPLEYEGENDEVELEVLNAPAVKGPVLHDGMHVPHKKKSSKLRPEHIDDVKAILIKAGYIEGAVQKQ
ncbi:MAG: hypothetical protein H0X26_00240 [Alphaproteobacteria bacterium]|nr:hypothetical protein [Alphaproteobacteria bacterium]